ncbi:MAG TPA: ATP-binding cassette domain-containing protein, partial [Defluviitoga sp.]|nr:ATP-binding cassette domain-containing protein [Defluviitoga sp.]HPZ29726.1 ATP-binding cassette domain-containing protein [Defluviitoga sp.]
IYVRAGEIVGLAGIEGNGQLELVQTIIGESQSLNGKIYIDKNEITNSEIKERRFLISYIPSDRKKYGLALTATLTENLSMTHHLGNKLSSFKYFINWTKAKVLSNNLLNQYNIVARGINDMPKHLSGGNQQKVILAREFSLDAPFLLLDQPTRGLDVGSIEYVHNVILKMREKGKAILLISADLDELLSLSDRVYVIRNGKIVVELDPTVHSKEEVGEYMLGGKE